MIVSTIARRRYLKGLADLERHDLDALLAQFDERCRFIFVSSNTPMGADLHSKEAVRRWFERLDTQRFEQACAELVAAGVEEAGAEPIRDTD
jgi:ketosteroid isomerase-like protein